MTTYTPQLNTPESGAASTSTPLEEPRPTLSSPWLTVKEAAERARCGVKTVYREVAAGHLKAARIGGRRELRFLADWIDGWLSGSTNVMP
jgi:excisionase family DNA binding protein